MGNSSYKSETKNSYFNLLKKQLKKNQENNYKNINNINFSLLTKSFSNSNNPEPNLFSEKENIYWLSYLKRKLLFLSIQYNYIWAKNLNIFISKNKFSTQYKYISLFFYEEFQILSLPKLSKFHPVEHYTDHNTNILKTKKDKNLYDLNNDSSGEEDNNEFDNKSININNINGYKEIINSIYNQNEIKIPNDVLGSLASVSVDEINSFLLENEPTLNYRLGKAKLKEYIDIFRRHLCHKDHPINIIFNRFYQEFNPIIINTISSCKNILNENDIFQKCEDIIHQLQDFMVTLQIITKLFYSNCISYDAFSDEKDEFANLITFLVFNTGHLYKNIYQILQIINHNKIKNFEKQLEKFGEMEPEEIGVKEKFCLNKITKEYMNNYKLKKLNSINNNNDLQENNDNKNKNEEQNGKKVENDFINKNRENFKNISIIYDVNNNTMPNSRNANNIIKNFPQCNNNNLNKNEIENNLIDTLNINMEEQKNNEILKFNLTISEEGIRNKKSQFLMNFGRAYSTLNPFDEKRTGEPYYEAIRILKNISKCKTPLEKLVLMASISSFITDNIYKFWKPMEDLVKPSFLNIEADDLMKILIYIVYKSKMSKLFVHLDFVKYFTIRETLSTMIGYYHTLLEGALNFILEKNNKNEFLSK